ncbi:hypothetical protein HMF8227_02560 [Saliniradius amylolyticus]|uniref:DUF1499 domain-containing protein n=1 Tax=Saliniradius amylolyticus TaxID=2183582 RepID=A0A2S2E655_9ALTE|nr:DUF1499 domain-containing protein [Saliniradius amylolyticus]AWL13012.1 hypothetical protein HMF8227_02560 [Saliniradius amylolyticus]
MTAITLFIGVLAALMVALPGPLYQLGVVDLGPAFTVMRWSVYVGGAGIVLVILHAILRKKMGWSTPRLAVAVVLSAVAVAMPVSLMQKAQSVPAIHDITTDTQDPPVFAKIADLRADAPNPVAYQGEEVAKQQKEAYPDLQTLTFDKGTETVFTAALKASKDMGWQIHFANDKVGAIEATDTTFWWGFKDDVVIRVLPQSDGSKLDIRSKSRVGRSDLGKNAERIRAFIKKLNLNLS